VTRSAERPRKWASDAERVRAARARKAAAGLKEVRLALSAEARDALERLAGELGVTPARAIEYTLLARERPRQRRGKPQKLPDHQTVLLPDPE
jgi:hypothetical protein